MTWYLLKTQNAITYLPNSIIFTSRLAAWWFLQYPDSITITPGQGSYNSRAVFLNYPNKNPELRGQDFWDIRTGWHLMINSTILSPSSISGGSVQFFTDEFRSGRKSSLPDQACGKPYNSVSCSLQVPDSRFSCSAHLVYRPSCDTDIPHKLNQTYNCLFSRPVNFLSQAPYYASSIHATVN